MPRVDRKYERAATGGKVIPYRQGVAVFNGPFGRQPRTATFGVCRARSSSAYDTILTGSASFPARHTFVSLSQKFGSTVKARTGLGLLMTETLVPSNTVRPKGAGDSDHSSSRTYCGKNGSQTTGFGVSATFRGISSAEPTCQQV